MKNPLRWIADRFARSVVDIQVVPTWQAGRALPDAFDARRFAEDGYRRNVIILACVSEIATSLSQPPINAFTVGGDDQKIPLPYEHELSRLLRQPEPKQTMRQLRERLATHLKVAGNSYIFKIRNGAGMPVQLRLLQPEVMRIIPATNGSVTSYEYGLAPNIQKLAPEDVIHIQCYPDPLQSWYGLSPVAVLASFGDIDNAAASYIRAFFANAGAPSAYLKFKTKVRPEERDRIKTLWHEQYSGEKGWHKIGVFDADVDYQKIGSQLEELNLANIFGVTETRICAAFQVPPILIGAWIGLLRSTYSNYAQARLSFWQETLVPDFEKIDSALTLELASEFGANIAIETDLSEIEALQAARRTETAQDFALTAWNEGLLTRNEARLRIGEQPDPDGDVYKLKAQDVIEDKAGGDDPYTSLELPGVPEQFVLSEGEEFAARPDYKALHRLADALAPKLEAKLKKAVASAQKATRVGALADAIQARDRHAAERAVAWDRLTEPREEIAAGLKKLFMDSARMAVHIARHKPGIKLSSERHEAEPVPAAEPVPGGANIGISFDLINDLAVAYAHEHAGQLVTAFADKKAIRDIITRAFEEGIPPREAARLIREHIGLTPRLAGAVDKLREKLISQDLKADLIERKIERYAQKLLNYRARMIARNETMQASNSGQRALWGQGVADGLIRPDVYEQEWIISGDKRTCPVCLPLDGERAPMGGLFTTSVGMLPGPPAHVQCRCSSGLVRIEPQKQMAKPKESGNGHGHNALTAADIKRIIAEIPAPVIHVDAPATQAIPAPIVNVPQPVVNVEIVSDRRTVKRVERDENGLITRITEEQVN